MKRLILTVTTVAALCAPLAACGTRSEGEPHPDPVPAAEAVQGSGSDFYYLTAVRLVEPSLDVVPDADLTQLGHSVCEALDVGAGIAGVGVAMTGPEGLTAGQAGAITGGAIQAYCPEHDHLIPPN